MKNRDLLYYEVYESAPDRPYLVFIHGAGGSMVTWKRQIKAFKNHFNLLLLDLRDHGHSKKLQPAYQRYDFDIVTDDVLLVLEALNIKRGHFMSLSLGSIILQKLNERRPEMMLSMIMAGGVFKADWRIHLFAHTGKFFSYFVPFRWIYDTFSLIVMPRKNHQPSRRLFRLQSRKLSPKEFLKWLGLYRDFFQVVRRFYQRPLDIDSLIVMGAQDHVFLQAARRFCEKHAQRATLVVIERCGHVCNLEQPQRFNEIVLEYLGVVDEPVSSTVVP